MKNFTAAYTKANETTTVSIDAVNLHVAKRKALALVPGSGSTLESVTPTGLTAPTMILCEACYHEAGQPDELEIPNDVSDECEKCGNRAEDMDLARVARADVA